MTLAIRVHGPIVSSGDPDAHLRLFATFGMRERARREYDAASATRLWGTSGLRATEIVLETPGTPFGARIVAFDPPSGTVIRDRARGSDADAPKVIDFYAPDFDAARAAVERDGWHVKEPIAAYEMPEGRFREAHVWGPDEVVCALLDGPPEFFARFATLTDGTFSEPQSLSGPVSELEPAQRFFEQVFDLRVVYRYGIDDESFGALVGGAQPRIRLRSVNVGLDTREPYFGIVHYGLPPGEQPSIAGRARPPHRGTLGATILVRDAAEAERRARAAGAAVLAPLSPAELPGLGHVRSVLLHAPNGGCYAAVEVAG